MTSDKHAIPTPNKLEKHNVLFVACCSDKIINLPMNKKEKRNVEMMHV